MNASLLSGIAAALKGGLQGYQTAQTNQRQAALDELARKRQEDDIALRQAAIQANALARKNAEDAKAKALEEAGKARDRREFQAPILADVNKHGVSPATEEALSLTDRYLGANAQAPNPIETLPIDPAGPAPDQMAELDGVTAFPESFKESKGDVLKARAQALTKKDGTAPTLPTLPNGRTPKEEEAYRIALARGKGKIDAGPAPVPPKPLSDKAIDAIGAEDIKVAQIDKVVSDALKMGGKYPGMWGSKVNSLLRYVGQDDPETTALTAQFKSNVSNAVRAISGAAATDAERMFIKAQEPNEDDTLDSMLLKAYNVSRFAKWKRANSIGNYKKAGRSMGGFSAEPAPNPMEDARPVAEILAEIKASRGIKGPAARLVAPPLDKELD